MHNATLSSYSYDFRKDFSDIAQPGLHRYLDAVGAPPDNGDWVNLRWHPAKQYVRELWNGLNSIQRDCRKRGHSDDFELYDIKDWTRESVATYVEARLGDILVDMEPAAPVDIYRAVHLGTEMARKQNAAGDLPFMIEVGPEAVAYAADRLKSKIERNCVYNPVTEVHAALLDYRFLKEMNDGGNVVYLDRYRQQQPKPEPSVAQAQAPEPKPEPAVKSVECMFQRVGLLDAKPREYIVKGFIPRNEVCNPFGRPDFVQRRICHAVGGPYRRRRRLPGNACKAGALGLFRWRARRAGQAPNQGAYTASGTALRFAVLFRRKADRPAIKARSDFLIANIEAIESDAGAPLVFLVIDTQSRTLGGDENSTKDGAAYAQAIEAIRQATEATLWIIAHTGHSEEAQDRPRGSSALLGAYDTFYRHKKTDERSGSIKITIDRDGLGGKEIPFTVELYETGAVNEDAEPVVVPYLEAAAAPVKFRFKKADAPEGPTPNEILMLKALRAAIKKSLRVVRADEAGGNLIEGAKYVFESEWREEFRTLYKTGSTRQAESQAFTKGRDGLRAKGFVDNRGTCYWPTMMTPN